MQMRCWKAGALALAAAAALTASKPEPVAAKPVMQESTKKAHAPQPVRGKVSWYGPGFAGRPTANGERFDPAKLTMAHRTLPLGTIVEVRNPENDRRVIVRVNDRGPYIDGRIADLSRRAAEELGMVREGVIVAELRVLA